MGADRTDMRIWAVIPAAGAGKRLGAPVEKAFVEVGGKPLLMHTIARLQSAADFTRFVVPVPPARCEALQARLPEFLSQQHVTFIGGGASRTESVARALDALDDGPDDLILVHDAARPLVEPDIVSETIRLAAETGAAIAAAPAGDTVKEADASMHVVRTLARDRFWLVQTPQVFRAGLLRQAYQRARREGTLATDDSALVELLGTSVTIVPAGASNFKITTPHDLALFAAILQKSD